YLDAKITEQHKAAIVRVCRAYDMAFDGFPPAGVSCSLTSAIGEWLDSMEEAGVELPLAREA
ncbi:hypothetical protein MNBD_GAMMA24-945, partial [hydrothermal vent metagenome]